MRCLLDDLQPQCSPRSAVDPCTAGHDTPAGWVIDPKLFDSRLPGTAENTGNQRCYVRHVEDRLSGDGGSSDNSVVLLKTDDVSAESSLHRGHRKEGLYYMEQRSLVYL